MDNDNKFNDKFVKISPLYKTKSGKAFTSFPVKNDAKKGNFSWDAVQKIEPGGKFIYVPSKSDKNEDFAGHLSYIPPEEVKAFADAAKSRDGGKAATRAPSTRVEANDDL